MLTLRSLFSEVARKRGGLLEKKGQEPSKDYEEVWDTFNRYVTSVLEQHKGVNITNFCRIGWKVEQARPHLGKKKPSYSPYFQLADSFAKAYGLDSKGKTTPIASEKELSPFEEFNFSKAAIRHSQKLTKDNMFSGLRYLVQHIGESISQGRKTALEFEVGRLLSQDKRAQFCFAASIYAAEGLEAPPDAQTDSNYQPSVTFQPPSQDALSLNLKGSKVGSARPEEGGGWEYSSKGGADVLSLTPPASDAGGSARQQRQPAPPQPQMTPPPMDDGAYPEPGDYGEEEAYEEVGSDVGSGIGAGLSHLSASQVKQEQAYKEAMDRHITEMEIRASEAIQERKQWEAHIGRCLQQERQDIEKRRALCKENSDFLQQQMHWNEQKRCEARKTFVEGASAHDFPNFSEPPEADLKKVINTNQSKVRTELDQQVRTNNTLKNMARRKERELERSQLEANREEMQMLRGVELAKRHHEKEALSTAWNREIRMKNIWRAIENHQNATSQESQILFGEENNAGSRGGSGPPSRLMTGSSRRTPLGASMNLAQQKERLQKQRA